MGLYRGLTHLVLVGLTVALAGCGAHASTGSLIITSDSQPAPPTAAIPSEPPNPIPNPHTVGEPMPQLDARAVVSAIHAVERRATVGAFVLDRQTGTELLTIEPDRQFRSASLVKLLIAIDTLASGGDPKFTKSISAMLSRSDDAIASSLWVQGGGGALVTRTSALLGLTGTALPPPSRPGRWGDVSLTARDVVRIYEYVLTALPEEQRTLMVDAMANAPRAAADGFDQYFGIPDGLGGTWAIKQGWSDSVNDIVLHSTGLVGAGHRYTVVLLTSHPLGVSFKTAAISVTAGAKALSPLP
jgi:hypothetical protein